MNGDSVRAAMPTIEQKNIEREELKKQLDAWLANGNIITTAPPGGSGLEQGGRKALTINEAAQRAKGARHEN